MANLTIQLPDDVARSLEAIAAAQRNCPATGAGTVECSHPRELEAAILAVRGRDLFSTDPS